LTGPVISVAGVCDGVSRVFMTQDRHSDAYVACPTERATIEAFSQWLVKMNPDVLIGWNVVGFDLRVLLERANKNGFELKLGRGRGRTTVRDSRMAGGMMADVEGRLVLDGRRTLQASGYYAERYSLEYTSQTLLGEGKAIEKTVDPAAEIVRMHREEPDALAQYNLQDCVLVDRIFKKQDLIGFVVERQQLTGLAMDRIGGSVAAFDYLYLPRLHRKGVVAGTIDSRIPAEPSPGGWVMEALPGLFKNVLVLDFKSLYPSIIRTFCVDPYALIVADQDPNAVEGFKGATFHSSEHILPHLIEDLWSARDEAKRRGDQARSSAIKVLMNSFYGVLGTTGCRFFASKLASSITMRGHQVIQQSRDLINADGYQVIYGDTDSLFVRIGDEHDTAEAQRLGQEISTRINQHWKETCTRQYGVKSHLEFEFETHFQRLYMPTKRGSSEGSKKRYAGLVATSSGESELVIKGLEAARTDWTPLARRFQKEVFRRVFKNELDGLEAWVQEEVDAIRRGERDAELRYTKRLRRPTSEYKKNIPPHVRAAILLGASPRFISYYITVKGPQPDGQVDAPLDYEHYIEKQLQPAGEGILHEVGIPFGKLAQRQMSLF
jgi:DNA polymerase-2